MLIIDPKAYKALYNKVLILKKLGKLEDAIEAYDMVLKINSKDVVSYYNKGIALEELGRYQEAIKCYDNVLKIQL